MFRRILGGIGANIYGQAVLVVVQLSAVPVLATYWGAQTYGIWLMLFTVPSYLTLADFGFATAAANDMTKSVARGNCAETLETFQSVRIAVMVIGIAIFLVCALAISFLPEHFLAGVDAVTHGHAHVTILLLVAYGLFSLQNNVALAGFRSVGLYALGTTILMTIFLAENMAALLVVALGGDVLAAAMTYFSVRAVGNFVFNVSLRLKARWLSVMAWPRSLGPIRKIMAPAAAVMALPIAQATFLQGTVLMVGAAAGAQAVPTFTTVRTLTRVAIQLTAVVNHALMPEFTVTHTSEQQHILTLINLVTSAAVLAPILIVTLLFGPSIIALWTHGVIHPPYALIVIMSAVMVAHVAWQPISVFIVAINEHARYSYIYLIAALACMALAYPLTRLWGTPGAALSLLLLDSLMVLRVSYLAHRLRILDPAGLRRAAKSLWAKRLVVHLR
ncbi:MAG: hypothetical protein KGO02_17905 [Alphaproteobacteria bacterium]|nr:hypothetical protein [Alphaproteobacteria bacterium]